jgi:hypothetical protein
MQYEFTQRELNIIQEALKNLLEIGITEPQENFLRNIDEGMSEEEATQKYAIENKRHWNEMLGKDTGNIYRLYKKLFDITGE